MTTMLSGADIRARYDAEWVLIEDPQTDQSLQIQGGRVLYHSRDRDEVYRQAVKLRPSRFAILFTGTMPQDTAIVL
jgi:hypothetical protein